MRSWPGDIRFWVAVAFLVRLAGIANPILETSHHWRQATVMMVARNFVEGGFDLLHPRMDTAGELTGITGMEFPLLNALIGACMVLFGEGFWYARLIVLIVGSGGVLAFHALVARHMDRRAALFAGLILLVSLWFMYGRKAMPDVFSLSLVLIGLERMDAAQGRRKMLPWLGIGALAIALGLLSKLTAGCLLATWPVLMWRRVREPDAWAAMALIALACLPAAWWYFKWVPHLVDTYGYWHFFMGKPMMQGAAELAANLPRTLDNFYFDALRFTGFAAFLFGLLRIVQRRERCLAVLFMALAASFLVVMLKAGDTFWVHAYYVLPFVPAMALVGGYGLSTLPDVRWAGVWLVLVAVEGIASQASDFRMNPALVPLLLLADDLDEDRGLIAINSGDIPTPMYFAHRRGWVLTNADLGDPQVLDSLQDLGCTRVVVLRVMFEGKVDVAWPLILEKEVYRIHAAPADGTRPQRTE